ncbi:MAG TPA: glycosyltransferase family protein [Chthoniobacter sp.]|jgi:spore coat polysaccharide biosynthesis protein SpsF
MRTIATIEARMNSSRLPGKVMLPILGKPALQLLIERLGRAKTLDGIVIATTTHPADAVIERLAAKLGVGCFRGSEEDVLERVLLSAQSAQADVIVEITGDCPMLDPEMVDAVVESHRTGQYDYVSNVIGRPLPLGLSVQAFATAVLAEVSKLTQDPADREHVSLYIYEHPERYRLHTVIMEEAEKHNDIRVTLDTAEDYALIEALFEVLLPINPTFTFHDVVELCRRRPELLELNRHIVQKRARG